MNRRAVIHADGAGESWLAARTERSLRLAGWTVDGTLDWARHEGPLLVVRSGCWLRHAAGFIPQQDGFVGLGSSIDRSWTHVLARCGGDFERLSFWQRSLPRIDVAYLTPTAVSIFRPHLANGRLFEALRRRLFETPLRAVHLAALDVDFDPALRVLQVVTTLQVGGAESITVDLAEAHNLCGLPAAVAALTTSRRTSLPTPRFFYDLTQTASGLQERARAIHAAAVDWGADLIHAHLISAGEAHAIRGFGLPLILTLHNMPPGWPASYRTLRPEHANLLVACSQAVATAAAEAGLKIPIRTAWNGIVPEKFVAGRQQFLGPPVEWRKRLGLVDGDRLLACLANPRPQKRLPLLPLVLKALDQAGARFHLAIAGGPLDHPEVTAAQRKAQLTGVSERVHWLGVVAEPCALLASCDALISVSSWEGLSVAQLEALAAGKPVIATDVGGAAEIAAHHPGLHLVAPEASPQAMALVVMRATEGEAARPVAFPRSFTRHAMARRYQWLYRQTLASIARQRPKSEARISGNGLWLVTNNFSTGGAQSSARRLLLGLRARGIKVRAAVIEEATSHPTPGRGALLEAGIRVVSISPPASRDASEACHQLLEVISDDPPEAVVFWNLITSYKVRLADGLFDTVVFDVSPGEMNFTSLERYFARPATGLPYLAPRDYGRLLAGIIVKYPAEVERAARVLGCPVHLIANGVELPSAPSARPSRHLELATATRLSPDKRVEDLLDAVRLAHSRMPPYRLSIAGGVERGQDRYARDLRRRARGLPVAWCGELPDTKCLLARSALFLMIAEPAGCPNASLEALAAGVPVIATNVGGAGQQVIDGLTGRLVPPRDPVAFADALCDLAHDPQLRGRMSERAREHIRRHFSLDQMLDGYQRVIFKDGLPCPGESVDPIPENACHVAGRSHPAFLLE